MGDSSAGCASAAGVIASGVVVVIAAGAVASGVAAGIVSGDAAVGAVTGCSMEKRVGGVLGAGRDSGLF